MCHSKREHLCENLLVMGGAVEGAMQEKLLVPIENILPVPDDFDLMYAPFVETAAFARHVTNGLKDRSVALIGTGTIGLLELQYCARQNDRVVCVDIHEEQLNLAKQFGANAVFNIEGPAATTEVTGRIGTASMDTVIDNVCSKATLGMACSLLSNGGELILVGIPGGTIELGTEILFRELRVSPRFLYRRQEFASALGDILAGTIRYRELLSRAFPMHEAAEAFEYKLKTNAIKVVLTK
jgi:propanol-preferring alcohol dehydrogenase